MKNIVILNTQVPYCIGGAEIHAMNLKDALKKEGHKVDLISIPFKWYPAKKILDNMLACRLLDIEEANGSKIDLAIGLKFPAYLIPHPNKVLWILHQHRTAYDQWLGPLADLSNQPDGNLVRSAIMNADKKLIPEAKKIFTNSRNVSNRLKHFCAIDSEPLYHPPGLADKFYSESYSDFIFFPSRITPPKRQELVLKALQKTKQKIKIIFSGAFEGVGYEEYLKQLTKDLGIQDRVEWRGFISDQEKLKLYANALAVVYPPIDEDYGYITLEAMLSSKCVITCKDSGGTNEFIENGYSGIVVNPNPEEMANAMDMIWTDKEIPKRYGDRAKEAYLSRNITWENVVDKLTYAY